MRNLVFLGTTIFMLAMTTYAQNQPAKLSSPPSDSQLKNTLSEANNADQSGDDTTDFAMYDNSGRYAMNNEPDPLDNNNEQVLQEVEGEYYE